MTYNEFFPWAVAWTKQGSSLITFHHMETRERAEAFAERINAYRPRQSATVMPIERARYLSLNQVYVN